LMAFGGRNCDLYGGDVREFDFRSLAGVDLLAAGAPCQPFSIGGKHRAHQDERNLFPQVFRAVRELEPRAVLVENVKGLLRSTLSAFVEYLELQLAHPTLTPRDPLNPEGWVEHLPRLRRARVQRDTRSDLQYRVLKVLLNAADYGVPQKRERVFLVAFRRDLPVLWRTPDRSHSAEALRLAQEVTGEYWKSHGVRRRISKWHPRSGRWRLLAGNTAPWATVRDALRGLPEPAPRRDAEGWLNHVGQPGARAYPGHTGSPLDAPAKTLKAGVHGVPGGENMLRQPNGKVRYFTVREAARLQTFPDDYLFKGAWGEAMRQIGNAVPVKLAEAVAASIRVCLQMRGGSPEQPPPELPASYVQQDLPGLLIHSA